ncbi:hypothetical protein [Streptomyces xantholiticus]|uniref:hypothetical protein n=1 Tax=Streptomyces xantholiticus TaxID=68285 RepID=UPI00167409C1|nr:hypothetical protein [Streptomyces xantholiticus]GGW52838.1 hypothetical protein GCM10010381_42970 [Streptomyces xantholiticus]
MLVHAVDRGVLVVTVRVDIDISTRAYAVQAIARLVRSHLPLPVVLVLAAPVVSAATLSAALRVHRLCSGLQVPLAVVTPSGAARRILRASADSTRFPLGVFAATESAVAASVTAHDASA